MKTPAPKENSTSSKSSQASFNKNGGSSFLSSTNEVEQPFFLPTSSIQKSPTSSFFSGGNKAAPAPFSSGDTLIQTKLSINEPGDKYEQEADAMADKVMRMSSVPTGGDGAMPQSGISTVPTLQRKCAACKDEEKVQREEMEEEESIQAKPLMCKAEGGGYAATPQLQSQLNSSKGGGNPLPGLTLSSMSQAFGADFSSVRIHTDPRAVEMSQGIQAKAFTHGGDIYFNRGQYNTVSSDGKKLLAHELTHTLQQLEQIQLQGEQCEQSEANSFKGSICSIFSKNDKLLTFKLKCAQILSKWVNTIVEHRLKEYPNRFPIVMFTTADILKNKTLIKNLKEALIMTDPIFSKHDLRKNNNLEVLFDYLAELGIIMPKVNDTFIFLPSGVMERNGKYLDDKDYQGFYHSFSDMNIYLHGTNESDRVKAVQRIEGTIKQKILWMISPSLNYQLLFDFLKDNNIPPLELATVILDDEIFIKLIATFKADFNKFLGKLLPLIEPPNDDKINTAWKDRRKQVIEDCVKTANKVARGLGGKSKDYSKQLYKRDWNLNQCKKYKQNKHRDKITKDGDDYKLDIIGSPSILLKEGMLIYTSEKCGQNEWLNKHMMMYSGNGKVSDYYSPGLESPKDFGPVYGWGGIFFVVIEIVDPFAEIREAYSKVQNLYEPETNEVERSNPGDELIIDTPLTTSVPIQ